MKDKIFVAVVCGATASGKTALAAELAVRLGGEVVSADSMQVYKGLDIASAKPTEEEKRGVVHHLMDFLEPTESFSVAEYVELARKTIADINARGRLPVICGGTGLYINSLIDNIRFDDTVGNDNFRAEMKKLAAEKGNQALWEKLNEADPAVAARLHPNNLNRIIRALEINSFGGRTMDDANAASRAEESPYRPLMLAIDYPDRQKLYDRINLRVDIMLDQGLEAEAREFYTHADYSTAAQAIGYKELKPYLDGSDTLENCAERLKQATRHYAKRQLTWFRRDERIRWLDGSGGDFGNISDNAENLVKKYRNNL